MRRPLGPFSIFAAAAYLTLGCQVGQSAEGPDGGAGGSSGTALGAGGGEIQAGSTAAGSGGGPTATSDATLAKFDPTNFALCIPKPDLSEPAFFSVPHARATVSATQVRGILLAGKTLVSAPPPSSIRSDELLSYYHLDYPVAPSDDVTVVAELVPTGVPGQLQLQVGVQAPKVMLTKSKEQRRQTSLTVLVDTSKSMEGESLARANAAVLALASSLNAGDVFNLVTTDTKTEVVHRVAASTGDPALFQVDPPLKVSGAGSLQTGVDRAYEAATTTESHLAAGINRLVVITDGGGLASSVDTRGVSAHWIADQIQLVGVGVGNAPSYNNELLGAMSAAGHGANLYLDSVNEADPALHDRFDEVMDEAAADVTIGVSLPSVFQIVNVDNSGADIVETQLLTSDLGRRRSMVFRHFVNLCNGATSPELLDLPAEITVNWSDPALPDRQSMKFPFKVGELLSTKASYPYAKTSAILAFANALQSLQMSRFDEACKRVTAARKLLPSQPAGFDTDPEIDSILDQIQHHPVRKGALCP